MPAYDAIVVGLGVMGSAALHRLACHGQRVLGIEAFAPGHARGSSHGESRIIRLAYFEHPDYVPLLRRAYALWQALEAESGLELLRPTGGLFIGPPGSEIVAGSRRSARAHDLAHELLDAAEIRRRYPALQAADGAVGLFERTAGILFVERCLEAFQRLATARGAELHFEEPLRRWSASDGSVTVETATARYSAARLVLAAGPWLGQLLPELGLPLQPERVTTFWLQPRRTPELFEPDRLPIYIWDTPELGVYYGFPHLSWPGAKVGRHHSGEACDPSAVRREVTAEDEARARAFVRRCLPAGDGPVAGSRVCLYTNTPDEHFVVDHHPRHANVVYAGGFSGHGFKFAAVVGELLADLALEGRATPAADFLRAGRLAGARSRVE